METNWIVLALEDLNDYLVGAQMDALTSAALASGQTNPFGRVMPDVAARIRAEVRGCKSNRVSNLADSIPPDLKWVAAYLVIEAMNTRLSLAVPLTEDQKTLISDAKKYLTRVSQCAVPIAQPSDPESVSDVQSGGMVETAQEGNSGNSREELSRL